MAKNKKKHKKPQAPPKPKHEQTTTLVSKAKQKGKYSITALPCLPDLGGTGSFLQNNPDIVFVGSGGNDIPGLDETGIFDNASPQQIKSLVEKWCDKYLKNITDIPDELNLYSDKEYNNDVIDFTEYMSEILKDDDKSCPVGTMNAIINNPDFDYDPSWFWSTDEFFDIKISENLLYKAHRITYDSSFHCARYRFVEYQRFHIKDDAYIMIPTHVLAAQFVVSTINAPNMIAYYKPEYKPVDMTSDAVDISGFSNSTIGEIITDAYQKTYGDDYKAIELGCMGSKDMSDLSYYILETCRKIINKQDLNILRNFLSRTQLHVYYDFRNQSNENIETYHKSRSGGIFASALFLTNKFLKDKKLSKPVKTGSVQGEAEIILQNIPMRKTRFLGDKIKISSKSRPATPDMNRIIKYHIPEWERKEHLRKLKDGRIIKVRASHCLRKCVDMHGAKSNLPKTATDYKIK